MISVSFIHFRATGTLPTRTVRKYTGKTSEVVTRSHITPVRMWLVCELCISWEFVSSIELVPEVSRNEDEIFKCIQYNVYRRPVFGEDDVRTVKDIASNCRVRLTARICIYTNREFSSLYDTSVAFKLFSPPAFNCTIEIHI